MLLLFISSLSLKDISHQDFELLYCCGAFTLFQWSNTCKNPVVCEVVVTSSIRQHYLFVE